MEVHAHSHTARKKWTHYFWEFLMLFLAVFCGFLAEYQLEHKIEKDREKQYIHSLLKDLGADTAQLNARLNFRTFENWERDRFMDASPYQNILDASVFESHLHYQYPQNVFTLKRITGNPPLLSERKEDIDKCCNRAQMQKRLNAVLINRFYNLKKRLSA